MAASANQSTYERHAVLRSRGAPPTLTFINGVWSRCLQEPWINQKPHYIKQPQPGEDGWPQGLTCLHVFYDGSLWRISSDDDQSVFAVANTDAEHPNTVSRDDWLLLSASSRMLEAWPDFALACEGPNTEAKPFLLDELGVDFFLRIQLKSRKVIWFTDPISGVVFHSAAKSTSAQGGRMQPGKRYCHLCKKCISANNFHSQHLAHLHRPGRPLGLLALPDHRGNVELQWMPPTSDGGLRLTGYRLSVSFDNGVTWANNLDLDIDAVSGSGANPPGPSAAISLAQLAALCPPGTRPAYRFAVAASNRAGTGAASESSPPITASPPQAYDAMRLPGLHAMQQPPPADVAQSPPPQLGLPMGLHDLLAHDALGAHESASSYGAPAGQLGEPGPAIFPGLASAPAPAAATADLPPHATTDVLTGAPLAPPGEFAVSRLSSMSERLSDTFGRFSAAIGMDISSRFSAGKCFEASGRSSMGRGSAGSRRGSLAGRKTAGERKSLDMFDLEGLEGLDEEDMRLDLSELLDFASAKSHWKKMWPFCQAVNAFTKNGASTAAAATATAGSSGV